MMGPDDLSGPIVPVPAKATRIALSGLVSARLKWLELRAAIVATMMDFDHP
jgi:hypothetical protein